MRKKLTRLIGKRFLFRGKTWLLVEILEEENALVVSSASSTLQEHIQTNQYGQPCRLSRECLTLPLYNEASDAYSNSVMELLSGAISD
jgi:hypothetical protein